MMLHVGASTVYSYPERQQTRKKTVMRMVVKYMLTCLINDNHIIETHNIDRNEKDTSCLIRN